MINIKDIYNLLERSKTPYVKVEDYNGNKIVAFEENTLVSRTIQELQECEDMLKAYGKLQIVAGDETCKKANYKGAFKWIVFFEKEPKNNNQWGYPAQQQQQQQNWGMSGVPNGFVHNDVLQARLDMEKLKYEMELLKLEKKKDSGLTEYLPLAPYLLSAMGKSPADISSMMMMSNMASNPTNGTINGAPTNTLSFQDVSTMSNEEKNSKIDELMTSLSSKPGVTADHMIMLLNKLNEKPELVAKAVGMLNML